MLMQRGGSWEKKKLSTTRILLLRENMKLCQMKTKRNQTLPPRSLVRLINLPSLYLYVSPHTHFLVFDLTQHGSAINVKWPSSALETRPTYMKRPAQVCLILLCFQTPPDARRRRSRQVTRRSRVVEVFVMPQLPWKEMGIQEDHQDRD